jgi:hypothetical protein
LRRWHEAGRAGDGDDADRIDPHRSDGGGLGGLPQPTDLQQRRGNQNQGGRAAFLGWPQQLRPRLEFCADGARG